MKNKAVVDTIIQGLSRVYQSMDGLADGKTFAQPLEHRVFIYGCALHDLGDNGT